MSQDLPSKQWTKLSIFGQQRMLSFVLGPPADGLVFRPQ
jgi:hypothetical protein